MNDDTLTTALERMTMALEPPAAAHELISARRSQLRRRRRVTTGLVAASVVAIVATGGVLAGGLGSADPARDGVPVTSEGPAPVDTAAEENDEPAAGCRAGGEGALTPAEIAEFEREVLDEKQLNMKVDGRTIHAYVLVPDDGTVVYEMKLRRAAGDDVEVVSVTRCGR